MAALCCAWHCVSRARRLPPPELTTGQPPTLSTLRVLRRTVSIGGQEVALGGLGEVCTAEACRGQGLAAAVIRDALAHMHSTDTHLSLLHTSKPHLQRYYARFGYAGVPMAFLQAPLAGPSAVAQEEAGAHTSAAL